MRRPDPTRRRRLGRNRLVRTVLVATGLTTLLVTMAACTRPQGDAAANDLAAAAAPEDWLGDFTVGTDTNAMGEVHESDHAFRFTSGMVVHYSMRVTSPPPDPDTEVTVVWGGNHEAMDARETKKVGAGKTLAFAADTTGWPAGHYTVEAWVGDEQVDEQIFEVVDIAV